MANKIYKLSFALSCVRTFRYDRVPLTWTLFFDGFSCTARCRINPPLFFLFCKAHQGAEHILRVTAMAWMKWRCGLGYSLWPSCLAPSSLWSSQLKGCSDMGRVSKWMISWSPPPLPLGFSWPTPDTSKVSPLTSSAVTHSPQDQLLLYPDVVLQTKLLP